MEPVVRESLAEHIEQLEVLDPVAEPMQKLAHSAIPEGSSVKDSLSGTWLGHPLHPPLTDIVVGAWVSALALDVLGGKETETAADRLVGLGVLAAFPTAASGLSDWADLRGRARRVGTVHALGNTTALALQTLSWLARRRGDRTHGLLLSATGSAIAMFSAWLGGHLSFGQGVGVNQTAFHERPEDWTQVAEEDDLPEGTLVTRNVGQVPILLVRHPDGIAAMLDRCSHRGCALHEGTFENNTVVCRCHGSTFHLDGTIVRGPATSPQPRLDVRVLDGAVEVRTPRARDEA
jgi:nitrite reductase/ring-hydroxylating ferredoxin subunit/uncharacterized membrane protein